MASRVCGIARRQLVLKVKQRSWALALMFSGPLLFMLYATPRITGGGGLHQGKSDLQFATPGGSSVPLMVSFPYVSGNGGGGQPGVPVQPAAAVATGGVEITAARGGRLARKLISSDAEGEERALNMPGGEEDGSNWAQQARPHEQRQLAGQPQVWLYTLLGSDYEGTAELLPHWLDHYLHTLEFSRDRLLVVVNHNSSRPEAAAELLAVQQVLAAWGIEHLLWTGRYSSDAHLKVKLEVLDRKVKNVEDWIVIADSDEFHSYADGGTISQLLQAAERRGSNWVLGQMVDRVSPTGDLAVVQSEPDLFEQFPFNCHVVRRVSRGSVWKVVAAKAYWRTSTGNHYVVEPDRAHAYFGGAEPGVKNPRGGWFGAEDLWPLTPYSKSQERYQYSREARNPGLWQLEQYPTVMPVYHFKWHHGVLQSAADRYAHYSGNVSHPGGFPRYKHYNESRNILEALAAGRIDLTAAQCSRAAPLLTERVLQ